MARKRGSSSTGTPPESDDFSAKFSSVADWAKENTQIVVVLSVVLVLGLGALAYYLNYQSELRSQATDEFERIQQTVVATGNTDEALSELQNFLNRFGDTPVASEARLLLAEAQLREEMPEEAIATLEPLTARLTSDPLAVQGAFLRGTALEHAERDAEAEDLYLRIAEESDLTFQIRIALDNAARLRKERQDYPGAAELYERILGTFEGEDAVPGDQQLYELRLAEVRAAARST